MLLTIHNLPSQYGYTDIKRLLHEKCGVKNLILDQLTNDGSKKKVTVGLADEGDAALLARKINGLYLNGQHLCVKNIGEKKPSEQPYHSSKNKNQNYSKQAQAPIDQYAQTNQSSNEGQMNMVMNPWSSSMMQNPGQNTTGAQNYMMGQNSMIGPNPMLGDNSMMNQNPLFGQYSMMNQNPMMGPNSMMGPNPMMGYNAMTGQGGMVQSNMGGEDSMNLQMQMMNQQMPMGGMFWNQNSFMGGYSADVNQIPGTSQQAASHSQDNTFGYSSEKNVDSQRDSGMQNRKRSPSPTSRKRARVEAYDLDYERERSPGYGNRRSRSLRRDTGYSDSNNRFSDKQPRDYESKRASSGSQNQRVFNERNKSVTIVNKPDDTYSNRSPWAVPSNDQQYSYDNHSEFSTLQQSGYSVPYDSFASAGSDGEPYNKRYKNVNTTQPKRDQFVDNSYGNYGNTQKPYENTKKKVGQNSRFDHNSSFGAAPTNGKFDSRSQFVPKSNLKQNTYVQKSNPQVNVTNKKKTAAKGSRDFAASNQTRNVELRPEQVWRNTVDKQKTTNAIPPKENVNSKYPKQPFPRPKPGGPSKFQPKHRPFKLLPKAVFKQDKLGRFQAASGIMKKLIADFYDKDLTQNMVKKIKRGRLSRRLKDFVAERVYEVIGNRVGLRKDEIMKLYEKKYPPSTDHSFYMSVIEKLEMESGKDSQEVTDDKDPLVVAAKKKMHEALAKIEGFVDGKTENIEELYKKLNKFEDKMLQEEINEISEKIKGALASFAALPKEKLVCEKFKDSVDEILRLIKEDMVKRLLNMTNDLTVRLNAEPHTVDKIKLHEYLKDFNVVQFICPPNNKLMYAQFDNWDDYDRLIKAQSTCIDIKTKSKIIPTKIAGEWNSVPADVFPENYDLDLFKARVNRQFLDSVKVHFRPRYFSNPPAKLNRASRYNIAVKLAELQIPYMEEKISMHLEGLDKPIDETQPDVEKKTDNLDDQDIIDCDAIVESCNGVIIEDDIKENSQFDNEKDVDDKLTTNSDKESRHNNVGRKSSKLNRLEMIGNDEMLVIDECKADDEGGDSFDADEFVEELNVDDIQPDDLEDY